MAAIFAAALFFAPRIALADAAPSSYLDERVAAARALHLADDPAWLRLLHARPLRFGAGVESTIDYPGFFRSPAGKTDPAAELDATLAAFFADERSDGESAACRYPARHAWLSERLALDPARLPAVDCASYREWLASLDPGTVHVVFASNDLDSPSSMFGHTLLRLDGRGRAEGQRLLAYAINYAAETSRDDGVTYALKGLTGSYLGFYSVMPYYDKVRQYQSYDHRDLWEYPLALDEAARGRLLAHLWELRGVGSDYYFFTENCSYQLLALINAARPDLDLTGRFEAFPPYGIPLDTVRELGRAGLLGAPRYEASNARRLVQRHEALPEPAQAWVRDYVDGHAGLDDPRQTQAAPTERAAMLEVAHDALYLAFQDGRLSRDTGLPRDRALLLARSQIETEPALPADTVPAVAPDQGHGSGRWSLGWRGDDRQSMAELRLRPAYHDRLDPPGGYMAGGEISFLDFGLLAGDRGVKLADATLLSVQALAPRSALLKPISWQIATGLRRYGNAGWTTSGREAIGAFVDGGPGLSWTPLPRLQSWLFAVVAIDANHDLAKDYAFGGGLRSGLAWQWQERLSSQFQAEWTGAISGSARPQRSLTAGVQVHLDARQGLRAEARYGNDQRSEGTRLRLLYERYF